MNQFRVIFTRIFKPQQTLKSITRLTTHRTHHGFGLLQNFLSKPKPQMQVNIKLPVQIQLNHVHNEEGFKKLHLESKVEPHFIHAIEMHSLLEDLETVVSYEEELNNSSTNESFCFEQVGVIETDCSEGEMMNEREYSTA